MPDKQKLFGKTLDQLQKVTAELGMPGFTARQIASWLYGKKATDISQMTDISLSNRELLSLRYEVGRLMPVAVTASSDGTKKYLFPTSGGAYIETAMIPDGDRTTVCVSSQSGCRIGCRFCMTGRQGLQHDLTAGEIVSQVLSIAEADRVTNIVYMGMGEPLDNTGEVIRSIVILTSEWGMEMSATRITVSTAGLLPGLREIIDRTSVHIAVSLHNPFPDQRAEIMPVEKAYPAQQVVELLRNSAFAGHRRVSFEYIVMEGLNDTRAHIKALARLLDGLRCRINLIRFHKVPGSPYHSPGESAMTAFREALTAKGIITTIRSSRGEDIQAACGLLSTKKYLESNKS